MPEEKPKTPETPPPAPPVQPDNTKQIVDAERRAAQAEARAMVAEDLARRAAGAAARAAQTAQPDPIARLAEEDVTLNPDQRRALLTQAIDGRARAMAGAAVDQLRREAAQRESALESKMALESVMNARPELSQPENASDFAAAMTKAKFELDAAGANYSPMQLAQRAAAVYDKTFRKVEPPPFVEGAGQPNLQGMPGQPPPQPAVQSILESTYGMKAGKIEPLPNPQDPTAISAMNNNYVNAKNERLLKGGVVTDLEIITRAGVV